MKGKKPLCAEFYIYYCQNFVVIVFFQKKLTNLINYSFWMTILSSFRLKTYFNGSFQLSVSILTNILAIFLRHLFKIHDTESSKAQTNENHTPTKSEHLKEVDVSRFPVVSNEATQELNSVAVNKHSQNTPGSKKQWKNERLPKLMLFPPYWKYLETNGSARTWQGPEYWVLRRGHRKKRSW